MSKSSDGKTTEGATASGTAKRLEEVLDNLDLETIGAPMLRTLLSQTMETLKIARRRVDEQQNYLELLSQLSTTDPATGLLNMRGLHLILRRVLARAKRDETESGHEGSGLARRRPARARRVKRTERVGRERERHGARLTRWPRLRTSAS